MHGTTHYDDRRMLAGTVSSYSFEKPPATTATLDLGSTEPGPYDDRPEIPASVVLGEN